ncbi:MAG: hypothetical protein C4344_02980 [Acidimicrobiia bacterium]
MGEVFIPDRLHAFALPPAALWERIADVGAYRSWWPWLRELSADGGLCTGARWECLVQPPLPHRVRFFVTLERVEPGRLAVATLCGDIVGEAVLGFEPAPAG